MIQEFHPVYTSSENEYTNLKRYMHPSVYISFIYKPKIWKQHKYLSVDECLKKMWHMCVHTHPHKKYY